MCVSECAVVCIYIGRQKRRNPSQCSAARTPLPGANFPDAPQSGARNRLSPPAGLGRLPQEDPPPPGTAEPPRRGAGAGWDLESDAGGQVPGGSASCWPASLSPATRLSPCSAHV